MIIFFSIIFLFTFCYFIYSIFKKSNKKKKKLLYSGLTAFISLFIISAISPHQAANNSHSSEKEQVRTVYVGKKDYQRDKKYQTALLAKKSALKKELTTINKQEKEAAQAQELAKEKQEQQLEAQKQQAQQQQKQREEQEQLQQAQKEVAVQQQEQQAQQTANTTNPNERTVYIAPNHGKKYHYDRSCRGLRTAVSISSMTESEAQAQGYTLCKWES